MTTPSPYEPIPYYTAEPPKPFAGWRTGSITFGVIAIVAGVLSAGMGLLAPLALVVPHATSTPGPRVGTIISGMLLYLVLGAALIWLGVGMVRLRRWVRPLVLTAGTIAIASGLFALASMIVALPVMRQAMAAGASAAGGPGPGGKAPPVPTGMFEIVLLFTLGFVLLISVIAPGLYVWFYRKPTVRQMLEYYDPVPRWTDRCPVPVMGLVVAWAMASAGFLMSAPEGVAPVFGTVLFGLPAAGVQLAGAAAAGAVAWLAYRRRPAGWWGSLVLLLLWALATILTLLRPGTIELYRRAGYTEEELTAIQQFGAGGVAAAALGTVVFLLALGYLVYVRRFFFRPQQPPDVQ